MPGPGGAWSGECLMETPRRATAAGGTHPIGMHSCLTVSLLWYRQDFQFEIFVSQTREMNLNASLEQK